MLTSMRRLFGINVLLITLSSCSIYQPVNITGGYSDNYQGKDIYQISYKGNDNEDYDTVKNYALRRAAHLAINNHHQYFEVLSTEDMSKKYQTLASPTNASPSFYNENTSPNIIRSYGGNIVTHNRAEVLMVIRILGYATANTYDAKAILAERL